MSAPSRGLLARPELVVIARLGLGVVWIYLALAKLAQEDPSFRMETDVDSGETIIKGMGELHLDIKVDILKRTHGVEVQMGKPQVASDAQVAFEQADYDLLIQAEEPVFELAEAVPTQEWVENAGEAATSGEDPGLHQAFELLAQGSLDESVFEEMSWQ